MVSRSTDQIKLISNAFQKLYNVSLEKVINIETSGFFKRLLVSLCTSLRDNSNFVDQAKAHKVKYKKYF